METIEIKEDAILQPMAKTLYNDYGEYTLS